MRREDSPTMTQKPCEGLFLNLLKCATPFLYCNLQLRRQTKTNKRLREAGGGGERKGISNNTFTSFLSSLAYKSHNEIWIMTYIAEMWCF